VSDLVAKLLAAIEDAESAVIKHRDGHDGPCLNFPGQHPEDHDEYDSCYLHVQTASASPYRDVQFGLRMCSAHREIVEHHSRRGKSVLRNGEFIDHCAYCQQPIPCPDLVSLARGYGIEESS
jgi:hypothetical protein